jgi:hypothetical protein
MKESNSLFFGSLENDKPPRRGPNETPFNKFPGARGPGQNSFLETVDGERKH